MTFKPLTAMKWDFLRSLTTVGAPNGGLAPQLQQWVQELQRPIELESYGRFINRFKIGTTVQLASPDVALGAYGCGFLRPVHKQRNIELESFRSRGVVTVISSFGEGMAWASRRTGFHHRLVSTANCEMQVGKFGNVRLGRLSGIERMRDLLLKAKILLEGERQPALSGNGGRKGFWFRCGMNWGYSPVAMFLTLTAFKLAVIAPELVPGGAEDPFVQLKRFYGWYKGLDDDARLAQGIIARGLGELALAKGQSLYEAWLISQDQTPQKWPVYVGYLRAPTVESTLVMSELLRGKRPHLRIKTAHVPGMGMVPGGFTALGKFSHLPFTKSCNDLLLPSMMEIYIEPGRAWAMQIPRGSGDVKALRKLLAAPVTESRGGTYVIVGEDWFQRTPRAAKKIRKALLMLEGVTTFGEFDKKKPVKKVEPPKTNSRPWDASKKILFLGER